MDRALTVNEVRVLGSLVEKEITTPDNYPMTMNGLTNACNQSSNREPVMQLTEEDVTAAVEGLRHQNLARVIKTSGSRVNKVQQLMATRMDLEPAEVALLTTLMLRGPQTAGELRTRSDRLHAFDSLEAVDAPLNVLITRNPPLVARLPRHPGQKEQRFAHLMAGEPVYDDTPPVVASLSSTPRIDRVERLEEAVAALQSEVAEMRAELERFRKQFE